MSESLARSDLTFLSPSREPSERLEDIMPHLRGAARYLLETVGSNSCQGDRKVTIGQKTYRLTVNSSGILLPLEEISIQRGQYADNLKHSMKLYNFAYNPANSGRQSLVEKRRPDYETVFAEADDNGKWGFRDGIGEKRQLRALAVAAAMLDEVYSLTEAARRGEYDDPLRAEVDTSPLELIAEYTTDWHQVDGVIIANSPARRRYGDLAQRHQEELY